MIAFWATLAVVMVFGFVVFMGAPYVPSQKKYVRLAFEELYPLDAHDTLVDVGSGDGIVQRIAASYGARAIGYEINPVLVMISKLLARGNPLITTHLADLWRQHLPDETTVVYIFGVTRDMKKFEKYLQNETNRLNRPLSVISHGASMAHVPAQSHLNAHALYVFKPLQPA